MTKVTNWFKKNNGQLISHILIFILLVMVIYPLILLVMKSFKTITEEQLDPFAFPKKLCFDNYEYAWAVIRYNFENSIFVTCMTTVLVVILAAMTAFAFERFNFPFKEQLYIAIMALMMIPGVLTITSKYKLINQLGLMDNMWGVILPTVAGGLPMSIILLRTSIKEISKEMFEAAEMDGAHNVRIFIQIVIPMIKPIIAALVIMQFVATWNDYLWPRLVLTSSINQTIPVRLVAFSDDYYNATGGYGAAFAGYVISSIPLIVIFAVASKQFISGMTSGAFKM